MASKCSPNNTVDIRGLYNDPYYYSKQSPQRGSFFEIVTNKIFNLAGWTVSYSDENELVQALADKHFIQYLSFSNFFDLPVTRKMIQNKFLLPLSLFTSAYDLTIHNLYRYTFQNVTIAIKNQKIKKEKYELISKVIQCHKNLEINKKDFFIFSFFAIAIFYTMFNYPDSSLAGSMKQGFEWAATRLLISVPIIIGYDGLKKLTSFFQNKSNEPSSLPAVKEESIWDKSISSLLFCPLIEEVFFRCFLQGALAYLPFSNDRFINISSSVMFGAVHLVNGGATSILQSINAGIIGYFLFYPLRRQYGLLTAIAAHSANNLFAGAIGRTIDLVNNIGRAILGR